MSRLDNVIKDIENVNKGAYAWIYDDNGNIKDNVICGNVLDLLYELKDYEIETTEKSIDLIVENSTNRWNTYNWNANIDHHIDVAELEINDYTYMAIMVHRYGDVRANYTDRFLVRFDDICDCLDLESRTQYKTIMNDRYTCDIDILSDFYNVWDNEKQTDVGEFYEIEVEDLLEAIEECA
jgi:hypothetical protein